MFDAAFMGRWGSEAWEPTDADRAAAGELHTQVVSRVAAQPLGYFEGDERSALGSIHLLFGKARRAADRHPGARHYDRLAWHVLNAHVRPFTARWHPLARSGRLDSLDATDEFRADLVALRGVLSRFDTLLLELCDGARPPPGPEPAPGGDVRDEMAEPLPWGIDDRRGNVPTEAASAMNAAERAAVMARRATYGIGEERDWAAGLALSGGGIRSATFSLGVLVALARRGLLPEFDYLSTVSGGGYLGAFITTLMATPAGEDGSGEIGLRAGDIPFRHDGGEAEALRYVRHRSKYLQTSPWERLGLVAAQAYGMAMNFLALLLLPAWFALVEFLARRLPGDAASGWLSWGSFAMPAAIGVLVAMAAGLSRGARTRVDRYLGAAAVVLVLAAAWAILGAAHGLLADQHGVLLGGGGGRYLLGLAAALPLAAICSLAFLPMRSGRVQRAIGVVAGLAAPLLLVATDLGAYGWLSADAGADEFAPRRVLQLAGSLTVAAAAALLCLDVNFTSPYRHYRRKLAETFLIRPDRRPGKGPFEPSVSTRLSDAVRGARGPYPLLNCALNVPASRNPAMQGRLTDFFLFSPAYCGSPLTGYLPTPEWEAADPDLDLGGAMAVSGAAASPLMGLGTRRQFSVWMALLNVRLGYWVRVPTRPRRPRALRRTGRLAFRRAARRKLGARRAGRLAGSLARRAWREARSRRFPDVSYLLREMFGRIDERAAFLNVTDGGHIENLGVYELLRRRCKYIVAVDGEHDASMTFHGLTNLQRLASIDLGVAIDVDLDDLRLGARGLSRSHFKFCRVRYPSNGREPAGYGYLLYLKLSLTGNEGEFLRRYRLDEPMFPHHPTADQFFTEAQFEAYRSLGEHVGEKLFLKAIVDDAAAGGSLDGWFAALGAALLHPRVR